MSNKPPDLSSAVKRTSKAATGSNGRLVQRARGVKRKSLYSLVDPELHRAFKAACANRGTTMLTQLDKLVRQWVAREQKRMERENN